MTVAARRRWPWMALLVATACGDPGGDPLADAGEHADDAAESSTADDPTNDDAPADDDDDDTTSAGEADDDSAAESGTTDAGDSSGPAADAASTDDGAVETSGDPSGGDDGASAECTALMECCKELGADIYAGCVMVVDLAMPGLCDQILATYHGDGYCTGETWCADLAACCGELPPGPGWQDTCTYYADLGNQPQCAMLIGDYQLSGYCF